MNSANAEAHAAGRIETAKQNQEVVKAETKQASVKAQIEIEIAEREATRIQKEREGISLGELVVEENRAKGVRVAAQAEASAECVPRMYAADPPNVRVPLSGALGIRDVHAHRRPCRKRRL